MEDIDLSYRRQILTESWKKSPSSTVEVMPKRQGGLLLTGRNWDCSLGGIGTVIYQGSSNLDSCTGKKDGLDGLRSSLPLHMMSWKIHWCFFLNTKFRKQQFKESNRGALGMIYKHVWIWLIAATILNFLLCLGVVAAASQRPCSRASCKISVCRETQEVGEEKKKSGILKIQIIRPQV